MLKILSKGLAVVCATLLIAGCAVKTYTQVRDREDQVMEGNAGYLHGTPPPEAKDRGDIRKTRTTYVLEIQTREAQRQEKETKAKIEEAEKIVERARQSRPIETTGRPETSSYNQGIKTAPTVSASGPQGYTVGKDDTLQKISKRFYGTYRKWNKIYEANKDKIQDPNRIKEGLILVIPE